LVVVVEVVVVVVVTLSQNLKTSRGNEEQNYNQY
jgi:hypothetical protein